MKRVFCLFLDFFHGGKTLFTSTFSKFSRLVPTFHGDFLEFFHGFNLRFHGHKIKNLLGRDVFFTGIISDKKTKATVITLVLIMTKYPCKKLKYFTYTHFSFTGRNLFYIFTETFVVQRTLY